MPFYKPLALQPRTLLLALLSLPHISHASFTECLNRHAYDPSNANCCQGPDMRCETIEALAVRDPPSPPPPDPMPNPPPMPPKLPENSANSTGRRLGHCCDRLSFCDCMHGIDTCARARSFSGTNCATPRFPPGLAPAPPPLPPPLGATLTIDLRPVASVLFLLPCLICLCFCMSRRRRAVPVNSYPRGQVENGVQLQQPPPAAVAVAVPIRGPPVPVAVAQPVMGVAAHPSQPPSLPIEA